MQTPSVGFKYNGLVFKGGDPNDPESWDEERNENIGLTPPRGFEYNGLVFNGGDPNDPESWLDKTETRSKLGVANDTVIELANSAAGGVKAVSDFISPGNRVSQAIGEFIKFGEQSQSNAVQAEKLKFQRELADAVDAGAEIGTVLEYIASNPLLSAAQALGSFAVPGGAIKGAGALARGLSFTDDAAKLAGRSLAAGTFAGVATGAAMGGGDAAGNAFELVMQTPNDVLQTQPEFDELMQSGLSAEQAKQELATKAARKASVLPAIVGGAFGALGLERLVAGAGGYTGSVAARAIKGFASEGVQEAFEEGLTTASGQKAASAYNPEIDPYQGVAGAAAMGGILGGVLGGTASSFAKSKQEIAELQRQEAEGALARAQTADEIVAAASSLASPPLDTDSIVERINAGLEARNIQAADEARLEMGETPGVKTKPLVDLDRLLEDGEKLVDTTSYDMANAVGISRIRSEEDPRFEFFPVPSTTREGVFNIAKRPVPEPEPQDQIPIKTPFAQPSIEPGEVTSRLQAAAQEGVVAASSSLDPVSTRLRAAAEQGARRLPDPVNQKIGQIQKAIEQRGGVATEIEADFLQRYGAGKPYDRIATNDELGVSLPAKREQLQSDTLGVVQSNARQFSDPVQARAQKIVTAIQERGGQATDQELEFLTRYRAFERYGIEAPTARSVVSGSVSPEVPVTQKTAEASDWKVFTPETGTLNVPRAQMPQVKAENRGAMVNFLNARGVTQKQEELDPEILKPTQAEFSPEKVEKARQFEGGERSILVSSDGYVLDGHHQWLAKKGTGEPVKAIRLDAPIQELLPLVREFPSSTLDESSGEPLQPEASSVLPDTPTENSTQSLPVAQPALSAREAQEQAEAQRQTQKKQQRRAARVSDQSPMAFSVGMTPNSTEPVTVKDGVVYIGDYPAQDFETGNDVTVAADAAPEQVRDALKAAGAVGNKVKFFGLNNAAKVEAKDSNTESPLNENGPDGGIQQPLLSRNQKAEPGYTTVGQVESSVKALTQGWANKPDVVVADSMRDEKIPMEVRIYDVQQKMKGAEGDPRGFFYKGKVYLISSEINSEKDIAEVLFHEALGHYGLRGVFGDTLNNVLDEVALARPSMVAEKAKQYGLDVKKPNERRVAAEEVLAEMAQTRPELGLVKRAIAAIRAWLRSNFQSFKDLAVSDSEILASYILPARNWVENKEQNSKVPSSGRLAFNRGDQSTTEEFKKWFTDQEAEQKSKVLNGAPFAELSTQDVPSGPIKSVIDWASSIFEEQGGEAFRPELGKVLIDRRAAKSSMAHGKPNKFKSAAFPVVKDVIERGVLILRNEQPLKTSFYYSAPVKIDGKDDVVTVLIRKDANAQRMYLHSVATKEHLLTHQVSSADTTQASERSGSSESGDVFRILQSLLNFKSGKDTNGQFDSENPDIRFSRGSEQGFKSPSESKLDDIIYKLQDKNIDLKRVTQAIKQKSGELDDVVNAYQKEELYHGRAAKQSQDFLNKQLKPLLDEMRMRKVSVADFETYLWNKHAQERNQQVAKVNPELQDGGSGIKTADAQRYLAELSPKDKAVYEDLAKRVYQMTRDTLQMTLDGRIESKETSDKIKNSFQFYVPLQREDSSSFSGSGTGFSVKGSSFKRAIGSERAVVNILANIADARERTITRIEKARVGRSLMALALENPQDDFWYVFDPKINKNPEQRAVVADQLESMGLDPELASEIRKQPLEQYMSKDNTVLKRVNDSLKLATNSVAVRIDGEDKFIVFKKDNPRAARMAQAMNNLDAPNLEGFVGLMGKFSRWFGSVNTQWNPLFGPLNFVRDVQGALLNLSTTKIAGKQASVMAGLLPAAKVIYKASRVRRSGGVVDDQWGALYERFQDLGAQTGYRDLFQSASDRSKDQLAVIAEPKPWDKVKNKGGAIFRWLEDYNESLENAVRLSAFKVALDQGLSEEQAASTAKNLTVNFNRKGQLGSQIGAAYMFFNSAQQGNARLIETLKGPAGKKIIAGGILAGAAQTMLLAAYGFDEDEPEEYKRQRSLIIPQYDGTYYEIPMPFGFHILPNLGRIFTEQMMGRTKKGIMESVADLVNVAFSSFNPVGTSTLSQTLSPTITDIPIALSENKDGLGRSIGREDFNKNEPTPGYTRVKDNTLPVYTEIAKIINLVSGGTDYTPGVVSPTPEALEYLATQVTGGVGREMSKTLQLGYSMTTGEELPPEKIPLKGRLVGDTNSQAAQSSTFYNNLRLMAQHKQEIKGRAADGIEYSSYLAENPEARMFMAADEFEKRVRELRKRKSALIDKGSSPETIRLIDTAITTNMTRFNQMVSEKRNTQQRQ